LTLIHHGIHLALACLPQAGILIFDISIRRFGSFPRKMLFGSVHGLWEEGNSESFSARDLH
jgi:hypothetical protein